MIAGKKIKFKCQNPKLFSHRGHSGAEPQPNRRGNPLWLPILRAATGGRPYVSEKDLIKFKEPARLQYRGHRDKQAEFGKGLNSSQGENNLSRDKGVPAYFLRFNL